MAAPDIADYTLMVTDDGFTIDAPFDQTPCNYTQTYDLRVYDKVTESQLFDSSFITGVNETITVQAPTKADIGDYEVHACSTVDGKELCSIFSVTVLACQVESLSFVPTNAELLYTVGEPSVSGGDYVLVQTPQCGYSIVVLTNEDENVIHDRDLQNFTIPMITNSNFIPYSGQLTMMAFVECENEGGCPQNLNTTKNFTLDYTIGHPCDSSVLDPLSVDDMMYKLTFPGETQIITPPQDSMSRKYGELDGYQFCG